MERISLFWNVAQIPNLVEIESEHQKHDLKYQAKFYKYLGTQ